MSRTHRSREQWQQLISEFEQSGLSQTAFCKAQQINPKYFSLKRSKLKAQASKDDTFPFIRLDPSAAAPDDIIVVSCGPVRIRLPHQTPFSTLVELVRALA